MSRKGPDQDAPFEFQKQVFAPFAAFGEFSVRTYESAMRQAHASAGEALDFGIAQARAALGAQDLQQLASRQATLANEFVGRQTDRSKEWLKLAAAAQAELAELTKVANDELAAAVRRKG